MARRWLPVHELQVGMYVAKLDLTWFRSPFIRHSFLIEQVSQIEGLVRAGVQTVEIDPDRGIAAHSVEDSYRLPSGTDPRSDHVPALPPKHVKPLAQLNEEHAQALLAKKQLDEAVHSIFSSLTETGTVHPEQATEAVQEITIVARTLPNSALFMALSQNRAGDASLSRHALATCTLALVLGQSFHFNPLELQELATAALLHDIGLLQIPPALIRRAHVTSPPLSQQERRQFLAHPRLGTIALEQQGGFTSSVLHIVGNHHPAYSGEITLTHTTTRSLSDRTGILVLVDKYDELLTGFGGSSPFAPHQAIQRLYIEAHQCGLDQTILAQFIKIVGIYPVHSGVKLNTNELAVVTGLNTETLHQPFITITHKPEGIEYQPPIVIDLAQQEDQGHPRSIESVLDGPPVSQVSGASRAA